MPTDLIIICIAAFAAGFIDAIVGGGGLVQTPMMLITFPNFPVATLLGTVKIPSFCGTAVSAYSYSKRVSINWRLVGYIAVAAFIAAFFGSKMVSHLHNNTIKPIILVLLVFVFIYTYFKKGFGQQAHNQVDVTNSLAKGITAGLCIGFYDGFIGPGTGSFLVLVFIGVLGADFMHASAQAKMVNLATNLASICYFAFSGHIIFKLAIPMACCNMLGGFAGTKLALLKGNKFIRVFFLLVVSGTIIRFAYDVFYKH